MIHTKDQIEQAIEEWSSKSDFYTAGNEKIGFTGLCSYFNIKFGIQYRNTVEALKEVKFTASGFSYKWDTGEKPPRVEALKKMLEYKLNSKNGG